MRDLKELVQLTQTDNGRQQLQMMLHRITPEERDLLVQAIKMPPPDYFAAEAQRLERRAAG